MKNEYCSVFLAGWINMLFLIIQFIPQNIILLLEQKIRTWHNYQTSLFPFLCNAHLTDAHLLLVFLKLCYCIMAQERLRFWHEERSGIFWRMAGLKDWPSFLDVICFVFSVAVRTDKFLRLPIYPAFRGKRTSDLTCSPFLSLRGQIKYEQQR